MLTKKHCQCRLFLSVIGRIKENYENSRKFEGVIKESTIEGLVGMYYGLQYRITKYTSSRLWCREARKKAYKQVVTSSLQKDLKCLGTVLDVSSKSPNA